MWRYVRAVVFAAPRRIKPFKRRKGVLLCRSVMRASLVRCSFLWIRLLRINHYASLYSDRTADFHAIDT